MKLLAALIFDAPSFWPPVVAIGAALTVGILWLYPSQMRGTGLLAWLPPLLRWLALSALVLALLKPVLLVPNSTLENGAVILALDCSKSMSIADTGRTASERVSLAAALGLLPQGARNEPAAALLEQINKAQYLATSTVAAQSDLEYARVSGRGINERRSRLQQMANQYSQAVRTLLEMAASFPPGTKTHDELRELADVPPPEARDAWSQVSTRLAALHDAAQKIQSEADTDLYQSDLNVKAVCDTLATSSRLSVAQNAIFDPQHGLLTELSKAGPVLLFSLGDKVAEIDVAQRAHDRLSIPPLANQAKSDLIGSLRTILSNESGRPAKAVVLFSDGRQVGGRGDLASSLRPSGVPIFTVNLAPDRVPDASIQNISISSANGVFAGETIDGQVEVRCRGLKQLPQFVTIDGSGGHRQAKLTPRSRTEGQTLVELTAHFSIPAMPTNGQPFDKLVFSIPPVPDEVTEQNNRVERFVKVIGQRINVLLCAAEPTRDLEFFSAALARRPWVRAQTLLLDPLHPRLNLSPSQLLQQDVIVLNDVPVNALDVSQWDAIYRLVRDDGGSVIIVCGPSDAMADYAQQPIAAALLPFRDLRPTWKTWPGEQAAFRFIPTPLGQREVLHFADGSDELRRWQELPPAYRYLQLPEKNLLPDVRKLLLEAESNSAVLTERKIGPGSVFFLGLEETWRWRRNSGEAEQDRFWRQLVRYAAGERYAIANGPVALDLEPMACEPAESVTVRARLGVGFVGLKTLPLVVRRNGRDQMTLQLHPDGQGRFKGELRDLKPGSYQIQVHGNGASAKSVASLPLQVISSDEAEMHDISADTGMLRRIARASGGDPLSIDQIAQLPHRLNDRQENESQFVQKPLYGSPLLFIFVLSCLAGEWALRKRAGLA